MLQPFLTYLLNTDIVRGVDNKSEEFVKDQAERMKARVDFCSPYVVRAYQAFLEESRILLEITKVVVKTYAMHWFRGVNYFISMFEDMYHYGIKPGCGYVARTAGGVITAARHCLSYGYKELLNPVAQSLSVFTERKLYSASPAKPTRLSTVIFVTSIPVIIYLGFKVYDSLRSGWLRLQISKILYSGNRDITLRRSGFKETPFPSMSAKFPTHSHGTCAIDRSCATSFMAKYSSMHGLIPYFYQRSKADVRHGYSGSRTYFWSKDMDVAPTPYAPPQGSLLCVVDVDWYLENMDNFMNEAVGDLLLYTIIPESVADGGEFTFTFNRNNEMEAVVSGGSSFKHKLYNYCGDSFITVSWGWTGPIVKNWLVDTMGTSLRHRALVLLSNTAQHTGALGWLAWTCYVTGFFQAKRLSTIKVVDGEFTRLDVHHVDPKKGLMRSTGIPTTYLHAEISAADDDSIASLARTSKIPLTSAQIQVYVSPSPTLALDERRSVNMLKEYHNRGFKPGYICRVAVGTTPIRRYQIGWTDFDADAKPMLEPFMAPILDGGCYAPDLCKGNEQHAVNERVLKVATQCEATVLVNSVMLEFVDMLIPIKHQGVPCDVEEVFERQPRPTQQSILRVAASLINPVNIISSFLKKEPYPAVKPARLISPVNGKIKLGMSRFMYPLMEHYSTYTDCGEPGVWGGRATPWYAFGLTPLKIANIVALLASTATKWTDSDLDKMDGHVAQVLRDLDKMIAFAYYAHCYHDEFIMAYSKTHNIPAVTTLGVKYDIGTSQASGDPGTAPQNTARGAFIPFLAFRLMKGVDKYEAWRRLGIYGGDDGGTPDVDDSCLESAVSMVGQKMSKIVYHRTAKPEGISFLSRFYSPDVWYGNPNSMCDLRRQLSKFHVTTHLGGITPLVKLQCKVDAYILTDENTPVIGTFVRRARSLMNAGLIVDPETSRAITPWFGQFEKESQFPNDYGDWMIDHAREALEPFNFDFAGFDEYVNNHIRSAKDLLHIPAFGTIEKVESKFLAVVNGEVVAPENPLNEVEQVPSSRSVVTSKKYEDSNQPPLPSVEPVPFVYDPDFWDQIGQQPGPKLPINLDAIKKALNTHAFMDVETIDVTVVPKVRTTKAKATVTKRTAKKNPQGRSGGRKPAVNRKKG